MTKLLVKSIKADEPGSWRKRRRLMEAMQKAQAELGADNTIAAFLAVEDIVLDRLETDDGTPVDEVLDELSAEDFDEILQGLIASSVPQTSAEA